MKSTALVLSILLLSILVAIACAAVGCGEDDDDDDNDNDEDNDGDDDNDAHDDDDVTDDDDDDDDVVVNAQARLSALGDAGAAMFAFADAGWTEESLPAPFAEFFPYLIVFSEDEPTYAAVNYAAETKWKSFPDESKAAILSHNETDGWTVEQAFAEMNYLGAIRRSPTGELWAVAVESYDGATDRPMLDSLLHKTGDGWERIDFPAAVHDVVYSFDNLDFLPDGTPALVDDADGKAPSHGVIYAYDGSTWQEFELPAVSDYWRFYREGERSLFTLSGKAYAAGDDMENEIGFVMSYDGSGWALETLPALPAPEWEVENFVLCGEVLYVLGSRGVVNNYYLWSTEGDGWTLLSDTSMDGWSYQPVSYCDADGGLWLLAYSPFNKGIPYRVVYTDGASVTVFAEFSPMEDDHFNGITVNAAGMVYLFGENYNGCLGGDGMIMHYDGDQFVRDDLPSFDSDDWAFSGLYETSAGKLMALAIDYGGYTGDAIFVYSGDAWTRNDPAVGEAFWLQDIVVY